MNRIIAKISDQTDWVSLISATVRMINQVLAQSICCPNCDETLISTFHQCHDSDYNIDPISSEMQIDINSIMDHSEECISCGKIAECNAIADSIDVDAVCQIIQSFTSLLTWTLRLSNNCTTSKGTLFFKKLFHEIMIN